MIIGITGNSGTGKTSICKKILQIREENEITLIDADEIVKEISVPGHEYFNQIINIFGKEIILSNGNIDRKKLANIVFSDNEKRELLNQNTYKYVVDEIKKQVKQSKNKTVIIDAPLLIESNLNKICDIVISVIADYEIKIERICKRDNIDKNMAQARLNSQNKNEFYIKNSDYIIINNNSNIEKHAKDIVKLIEDSHK